MGLAYEIAIDSFKVMSQQWHSMNSLFHALLSISLSFAAAVPLMSKAAGIAVSGIWVTLTLSFCLVAAAFCVWGRLGGYLRVIDPGSLYDFQIQKDETTFKREMVYEAGKEFKVNQARIKSKWLISLASTSFVVLQILALILWVLLAEPNPSVHTQNLCL